MSSPDPLPPIPRDFGWRYVMWFIWCNAITGLAIIQGVVAALMLASDSGPDAILTHAQFRYVVLANAVLTAIVAQVKRNAPPGPPPTKPISVPPTVNQEKSP